MRIILLTHPPTLGSMSMPRFALMLQKGLQQKGHEVSSYTAKPIFSKLPLPIRFRKWGSYIDQYILFTIWFALKIRRLPSNTLFVITDHALGPWVPLIANRPHVIHCHDFLAQMAAADQIPWVKISLTGKIYQKLIRWGYCKGSYFITVSEHTKQALFDFLRRKPKMASVVYNGVNSHFSTDNFESARKILTDITGHDLNAGYLLHVGSNNWYKNREAVVRLYTAYRLNSKSHIPLLLIGAEPNESLMACIKQSEYTNDIIVLKKPTDELVIAAYRGALALLFPSLAEGFGWPIAEAMACGCPVITTNAAPMTEVGGEAARYIPLMPINEEKQKEWLDESIMVIKEVVYACNTKRDEMICKGLEHVKRFDVHLSINKIEALYKQVLKNFRMSA